MTTTCEERPGPSSLLVRLHSPLPIPIDFTPPRLCYQPDKAHGSARVGAPVMCYGE